MTITAVFESLEEMQEFAGKLNGGSIQGAVQEFIKGEDIYRTSETKQQTCMQDKISEDRETPEDEDADEPMEQMCIRDRTGTGNRNSPGHSQAQIPVRRLSEGGSQKCPCLCHGRAWRQRVCAVEPGTAGHQAHTGTVRRKRGSGMPAAV